MSGMDDRAKQFKAAAEAQLTGPALKKEVTTLRRFLFRNQEYRFTKAAQQALYMAVIAHHGNPATHNAACVATAATASPQAVLNNVSAGGAAAPHISTNPATTNPAAAAGKQHSDSDGEQADDAAAEAPILRLLDDALKMPFTVFSSAQKEKLLSLYWAVLGTEGHAGGAGKGAGAGAAAAGTKTLALSLMDVLSAGKNKAHLSLLTDEGEEYAQEVLVDDAATVKELRQSFDEGNAIVVTVEETDSGARFVSFALDEA